MKPKDQICGTCKYYYYKSIDDGWVCVNDQSEYVADLTEYNDTCEEWEEK